MSVETEPVGVIGGSGFYELLSDGHEIVVDTPYGPPAAPILVGTLSGQRVAFLSRHGADHGFAAHRVPYRANIWALHSHGRADTYHDVGGPTEELGSASPVHHQTFADPYDAELRAVMVRAAAGAGIDVLDGERWSS